MMGTHWEQEKKEKIPCLPPFKKKKNGPFSLAA
jgi:hypothetical protein